MGIVSLRERDAIVWHDAGGRPMRCRQACAMDKAGGEIRERARANVCSARTGPNTRADSSTAGSGVGAESAARACANLDLLLAGPSSP